MKKKIYGVIIIVLGIIVCGIGARPDLDITGFISSKGDGTTTFATGTTRKSVFILGLTKSYIPQATWVADTTVAGISDTAWAIRASCKTDSLILLISIGDTEKARIYGVNYSIKKK